MPTPEDRMANQLKAMEQLIKRFPEQEAELRAMRDEIASGKLMPGTPLRMRKREGESPSVTQKARQMKFLEELGNQYPDKSNAILTIKDTLAKGDK